MLFLVALEVTNFIKNNTPPNLFFTLSNKTNDPKLQTLLSFPNILF